jgi:hypothetical protein
MIPIGVNRKSPETLKKSKDRLFVKPTGLVQKPPSQAHLEDFVRKKWVDARNVEPGSLLKYGWIFFKINT